MGSGTENPRRSMGPVSQTGSDIIERPLPVDRQTPVKTLPCPKHRLRPVMNTRNLTWDISVQVRLKQLIFPPELRALNEDTSIHEKNSIYLIS